MTRPLIEAIGLTQRFGDTLAVDDVSFDVAPGEVVGLLGANGAGKTTTIRMLLGLLRPSGGHARLMGQAPSVRTRRSLGYVPQNLGLYQELTVAENVSFSAEAYGVPPARLSGPLAAVADRLVRRVPLGLQRQLAFVCALQHRPAVLVLDEPTSGVDPLARTHLWDDVRTQALDGVAVLVTTHYMQEARQCDRLVLMARGRVVGRGSETDIVGDTRAVRVDTDAWEHAFSALDSAGVPVTLAGRSVRAIGTHRDEVAAVLEAAQVTADVRPVPATLDERMTVLAREGLPA